MHFEVLVEDQSGKKALDSLIPKIIGPNDTFRVLSYKGIGHIPKGLKGNTDPAKRALLNRLPELLSGYGKTPFYHPSNNTGAVIFVCDLDERCLKDFRAELLRILEGCEAQPIARFCIAIKEGESWLLGDIAAIKAAYPNAKEKVLKACFDESISGTWEKLADAVYQEGSEKLQSLGGQTVGKLKSEWAERITPHMDIDRNNSPSFQYFVKKLRELAA